MRALALLLLLAGCPSGMQPVDSDTEDPSDAALIGILVSPEQGTVPLGQELQLRATGLRADRSTVDLTAAASWSSSAAAVAQVSEALDQEGVVRAMGVGSAQIVAGFEGVLSPPATVRVTEAELIGLSVEPKRITLEVGQTVQLRATAAFSDNTRSDASAQVRWITGSGAVVTVDAAGRATAAGVGQTTIIADWDGNRSTPVEVVVVAAAQPNLRVGDLRVEPGQGEFTATLTIENSGSGGASDYWVDLFLDPAAPPQPGAFGDDYFPVFYTDAQGQTEVVFTLAADPGDHVLYVLIDSANEVAETNEGDNDHRAEFELTGANLGANLVISYFDAIADSESIFYVIDVTNAGTEAVDAFYVDLWMDAASDPTASGIGDEFVRVDGLAAGETTYADFLLETRGEDCFSWAMADTNAEVDELHEDDNIAGPLFVDSPLPGRP